MHRRASIVLAHSSLLLGALREGRRGDYVEAIRVQKLERKGQGNQSFAKGHRWHRRLAHTCKMMCEI